MQINLQTLKFDAKQQLNDYVNEKVGKLSQYDDKIIRAEVTLALDGDIVENKVCEIRLVVGLPVFSVRTTGWARAA